MATGSIREKGRHVGRFYSAPDIVDIRRSPRDGQEFEQRIMETHYRLRFRDCNPFAGLFDRVPRQLELFEDGTSQ